MKAYLVINQNKFVSYKEQYNVFLERQKALDYAHSLGYHAPWSMGEWPGCSDEIGVMSSYQCGDIHVQFMPIEVDTKISTPTCPHCLSKSHMVDHAKYTPDWVCHATHRL